MIDMSWFKNLSHSQQQTLLEGPALKAPAGVDSNFSNPPNKNSLGVAYFVTVSALTSLLVSIQIYSKFVYHKHVSIEDYISLVALGAFGTYIYFAWKIVYSPGLYVHQWNIKLKEMPDLLYNINAGSTVYGNVIMLLKIGILLHWTRLFVPKGNRNSFWWTCHITLWVNVLFYNICTFVMIFSCRPREKIWNMWVEGECVDMPKAIIVSAFINLFSDTIIFLLPQKIIWRLRMSTSQKLGTGAIFAAGLLATACAASRTLSTFDFAATQDISYAISELGLWCAAEMTAGFFVLCLPAIPKLFKSSPWMKKFISGVILWNHPSSDQQIRESTRSWPRNRTKREADASLFTNISGQGFVPLTNLSEGSVDHGSGGNNSSNNNPFEIIVHHEITVEHAENIGGPNLNHQGVRFDMHL